MTIYGLPGSKVPTLIVAPGSTGVVLSNLELDNLVFPHHGESAIPSTRFCSFFHLNGLHVAFDGARVSDLQFIGLTKLGSPDKVHGARFAAENYTLGCH
jgi:hypothetical protein